MTLPVSRFHFRLTPVTIEKVLTHHKDVVATLAHTVVYGLNKVLAKEDVAIMDHQLKSANKMKNAAFIWASLAIVSSCIPVHI